MPPSSGLGAAVDADEDEEAAAEADFAAAACVANIKELTNDGVGRGWMWDVVMVGPKGSNMATHNRFRICMSRGSWHVVRPMGRDFHRCRAHFSWARMIALQPIGHTC